MNSPYTRYVIDLAYRGTRYRGWERQANSGHTVQAEVERALLRVLREEVSVYAAGRTDAGVHALQMPAHFDCLQSELHPSFLIAVNAVLPDDVAVMRVYKTTKPNFHARFAGRWRSYEYRISFSKNPVLNDLSWFCRKRPNVELLQAAARVLPEYNSFESFCKTKSNNKTYNCDIQQSEWEWRYDAAAGGEVLVYKVRARRFLRGMVRTLVGTMMQVGTGEITVDDFRAIIEACDRRRAGMAVYAGGLFLTGVGYAEGSLIPYSPWDGIVKPR